MKKTFITGIIFGIVATILGVFIGLQASPVLANILLFPLLIISKVVNQPLGNWSAFLQIIGILFSVITWGLLFVVIAKLIETTKVLKK